MVKRSEMHSMVTAAAVDKPEHARSRQEVRMIWVGVVGWRAVSLSGPDLAANDGVTGKIVVIIS